MCILTESYPHPYTLSPLETGVSNGLSPLTNMNDIWKQVLEEIELDDIITQIQKTGDTPQIKKKLAEKGIDTRPLFYPIHQMPPYKEKNKYPISEDISRRGISLPSSVKLKKEEIEYICNELRNIL